ncbi:MAG: hypothetical protein ACK4ZU_01995 [Allorhizobium sp.]
MQFSSDVLNQFFAHGCDSLSQVNMPDIDAVPDYRLPFGVQYALTDGRFTDVAMTSAIAHGMGATAMSVHEYLAAKACVQDFISGLPQHNRVPQLGKGLAHLSNCMINTYVAARCLHQAQLVIHGTGFVTRHDGSPYDRLRLISNRIRHFDEDVGEGLTNGAPVPPSPIWLSETEVSCSTATMTFEELAEMLRAHSAVCRYYSESYLQNPTQVLVIT